MSSSWFYPKPTGDIGRDRNARTLQFSCLVFAFALGAIAVVDMVAGELVPLPILLAAFGLFAAAALNHAGRAVWAGRTAVLVLMLGAILLVFEAHDGFRSHAMLVFPGLLLISVMLLDRASYLTIAGIVLLAVAALGVAEKHGLTQATPGIRTPTSYDSIFYVELTLAVFAMIGSRIANDDQINIFDLRATIDQLSKANLELTESAEALGESEREQVSIYNAVRDVIFHLAVQPEGRFRFVSVNAAFLRVTGLSREMVVGKTVSEVIPEPSLTMVLGKYRQAIEEKTPVLWEETSDYPSGRLTGEVSVVPVFDSEGACTHLIGSVHDITEFKRAQEQAFARQKLESVGTLAGGIAHDFNNLLGGVLAQAELGLGELATGSNPEGELKTIRDVALRGSEIVRELMVYAGKESAVVGLVDVSQIVEEMLELLKVSVSKHAVIEANLGKGLPPVRANAAQLRQLVMNLVTNASEAIGDQDGVIRVSIGRVKVGLDSEAISNHLANSDYMQLKVSDTGRGMSLETQAKVFDPFFTTKSAGHGLGLAVVQGIVRDLGGSVDLVSAPAKGTTFRILLPFAETADAANTDAGLEIVEPIRLSQPRTVLLVEDEFPLRQAVGEMLRHRGFKVFEAGDGFSAISLLQAHVGKIDLILLDLNIPGASSCEVVAEAAQVRPDVRVILTSAYSQEMTKGTVSAPQVRSFIRKPFQLGDLVKTLENALSVG